MTTLPTTRLGRTGMHLTRVGFGAWATGGGDWAFAWGNQDDAASVAAIRHAVDSGINWIDTAAVYGLGHSEEVVAAALAGLPEADRPPKAASSGIGPTGQPRPGTVIAAGQHGEPSYLIRWTAGDYDSWFTPGLGARIEK
jgi:aryl-alcohol dehydrogenase-like predicted oxidoreductase